ncbi:hypothetical protein Lal_00025695 [Lupinus albus]|nr:hypothetical protein Lal_00025695 [Lupinus albus]
MIDFKDFSAINKDGHRHAKDLVRKYKLSLIILMETHCQFIRKVGRDNFNPLLEKIHKRMATWKASLLNRDGRLCLAKSVMWLPQSVCNDINRMTRNFVWGGDINKRSLNLVSWDVLTRHKRDGGLGLRETRSTNISLLGKMCWNMLHNSENLWCKVLQDKYLGDNSLVFAPTKANISYT